tara:strand:- start:4898 stop:5002 length:105 start_codon:yes stop_codon:yes gene_type:complete
MTEIMTTLRKIFQERLIEYHVSTSTRRHKSGESK